MKKGQTVYLMEVTPDKSMTKLTSTARAMTYHRASEYDKNMHYLYPLNYGAGDWYHVDKIVEDLPAIMRKLEDFSRNEHARLVTIAEQRLVTLKNADATFSIEALPADDDDVDVIE